MTSIQAAFNIPRDIMLMLVGFVIGYGAAALTYTINHMDD